MKISKHKSKLGRECKLQAVELYHITYSNLSTCHSTVLLMGVQLVQSDTSF